MEFVSPTWWDEIVHAATSWSICKWIHFAQQWHKYTQTYEIGLKMAKLDPGVQGTLKCKNIQIFSMITIFSLYLYVYW